MCGFWYNFVEFQFFEVHLMKTRHHLSADLSYTFLKFGQSNCCIDLARGL